MAKIYTKKGDEGQTQLVGGECIYKDHPRVDAYGQIDELNSRIGFAQSHLQKNNTVGSIAKLEPHLQRIQNELFNLGSLLACEDPQLLPKLPQLQEDSVKKLEIKIDEMEEDLTPLKNFILPGGSELSAQLHLCRTACRQAERLCVSLFRQSENPTEEGSFFTTALKYLNRLSDFFFVAARWSNQQQGIEDVPWNK